MSKQSLTELSQRISLPDDEAIGNQLQIVATEIKERLKSNPPDSRTFFDDAVRLLKDFPANTHTIARVDCLLDASNYYYFSGKATDAVEPASAAVALARSTDDKAVLRKALTYFGIIYADSGNVPGAIECYAEALDIAQALQDRPAECGVFQNLGVALMYAAQYREAIASLENVIRLAGNDESLRVRRISALSNIALCSLHIEDFRQGLKAAEQAVSLSPEPKTSAELLSRVLLENNYTRLLLEVDSIEKARERVEIARTYAATSKSVRAEIAAATAEGLFEVQAGRVDIGLSRLAATLEKARMLRAFLRDTLIAMVKAYEVIGQPERALVYLRELMNHTRIVQQDNALRHVQRHLAELDSLQVGDHASAIARRESLLKGKIAEKELFKSRIEMLERLAVAAELRDDSTGEHSYRVGKLTSLIAQEYGCDEDTVFMLDLAGRLHDIGKIGVPDAILLKPGRLNDAERQIMRTHTTVGAELLAKSNIPQMQMAEEIARAHHEWWDGRGYPGNASGTAIPLAARITALADVFDALTHARPYKDPWSIDAALEEIASLKGKQFDPQLTDYFLVLMDRLRHEHSDLDAFLSESARSSPFLQARSRIKDTLLRSKKRDADGSGSNSRLDMQR